MSRVGYAVLVLLLVGLGVYVFWQEAPEEEFERIWDKGPPSSFTVVRDDLVQEVSDGTVRLAGLERPLDETAAQRLWSSIRSLRWMPEHAITGVGEDQLDAYGIDGKREVRCQGLRLRWGVKDKTLYLWDGITGRIFTGELAMLGQLDRVSARLDQLKILNLPKVTRITFGDLNVTLQGNPKQFLSMHWLDSAKPQRPNFDLRVNKLFDLLTELRLRDVKARPPALRAPAHTFRLGSEDSLTKDQEIRLWTLDKGGLVQVADLPPQPLSASEVTAWQDVLGMFSKDYLFNLFNEFSLQPLAEVRIAVGGVEQFRLEKHGLRDVAEGRSNWDVVWPGGREPADHTAAANIAYSLDMMVVRDPNPRADEPPPPTEATSITFVFQQDRSERKVFITGDRIYSETHVATADPLPPFIKELSPDSMLDPALTFRGAERVVKLQRQWHVGPQAGRAETYAVQGGEGDSEGPWAVTYPPDKKGQSVSVVAIDQVARALCTAKGSAVRLLDAAGRAALEKPDFEIDVRFAPLPVRMSNDHSRLVDTNDLDLGFAFVQRDGHWLAIDKEGGISYEVSNDLVEQLQVALDDNLVVPVIPSLVNRIDITTAQGRLRLRQNQAGWSLQRYDTNGELDGEPVSVDPVSVRRHIRAIAALRSQRVDAEAGPFTAQELVGSVVCVFPGAEKGDTRVTLSIGPTRDGLTAVVVEGGVGMRGVPRGRVYVPADQASLLLVDATAFPATTP